MQIKLHPSWEERLSTEIGKNYFKKLELFLDREYLSKKIYPPKEQIFTAFNACSFDQIKVVIIGQDPYHQINQAHGLAFSVQDDIKIPPSLKNIFKEIESDLGQPSQIKNGNLTLWASQGIFLLNSLLTVQDSKPMSHQKIGWEDFTYYVIGLLNENKEHLVFMLWGKPALLKAKNVDIKKHLILTSTHPSPLSSYRGFFGCKHFSKCNEYLIKNNQQPIRW